MSWWSIYMIVLTCTEEVLEGTASLAGSIFTANWRGNEECLLCKFTVPEVSVSTEQCLLDLGFSSVQIQQLHVDTTPTQPL